MDILRTPDERFNNLPEYDFDPHYVEVDGVRIHYVDEGASVATPVLLLHGEPSWSYLYRCTIAMLVAEGHRVIAPDLVGFGRSDKPTRSEDYTCERHVAWMEGLLAQLDLRQITLVGHDWGGTIGLHLVAAHAYRFARIVASNTFLPTGDTKPGATFLQWRQYALKARRFHVGSIIQGGCVKHLSSAIITAYEAPFPGETYLVGARQFPQLAPLSPEEPAAEFHRRAWETLEHCEKPFLCVFSDSDPITRGGEQVFLAKIPGARGQPHATIAHAGHFLQEDQGEDFVRIIDRFISITG